MTDADITQFKLDALTKMAHLGITPGQFGRAIKQANPLAFASSAVKGTMDAGQTAASGVYNLGKGVLIPASALLLGAGALAGYAGEHVLGPRKPDVDEARENARIEQLRRGALRLKAETQAETANAPRRRKPPALSILSSV
jgi:hypothetical protein